MAEPDLVVYADGGSRGNPGPAGYGAVVFGPGGEVLAERAGYLGRVTNNVAEYNGLIAGLEAATELGGRVVAVRMDSKLVVEQMSGRWQVKHPDMKPLARKAAGLLRGFDGVSFTWVPRARNSHADRLANEAMDAAAAGRVWTPPGSSAGSPAERPAPVASRSPAHDGLFDLSGEEEPADADAPQAEAVAPPPPADAVPGVTRLLLIRHGETTWGAQNRFAGRRDVPLTALGRAEASAVGQRLRRLRPVAVVCSPLQRCRTTAEAIAAAVGCQVEVRDELIDAGLGEWTGLTAAQIEQGWPELARRWRSEPDAAPPGGESYSVVRERVGPMLPDLARRYPGGTVVVVTHAGPIRLLVTEALGTSTDVAYRIRIETASLTGIDVDPDGLTVVWAVNETGHLSD